MIIGINWRKLGLQLVLLVFWVLLVVLTLEIALHLLAPWMTGSSYQKIAKWERLQDDGYTLIKAGKYDEAEAAFRLALGYAQKLLVLPSREGSSAFGLGGALLLQNRFGKARSYFELALRTEEKWDGKSSPTLCTTLKRLTEVCLETGDFDAALDYAQRAVAIREAESLCPNPELPGVLGNLAAVYKEQKNYTAELRVRKRIAKIRESEHLSSARELGIAYYREGLIHNVLQQYGRAEILYQKSFAMLKGSVEPDEQCFVLLVREYANLMDATGRPNEAARLREGKLSSANP